MLGSISLSIRRDRAFVFGVAVGSDQEYIVVLTERTDTFSEVTLLLRSVREVLDFAAMMKQHALGLRLEFDCTDNTGERDPLLAEFLSKLRRPALV